MQAVKKYSQSEEGDRMKRKHKIIFFVVIAVVVILCINLLYFFARYYNNAQNYPHKGVDLEETFLKEFPGNYTEILRVEQDGVTVFLGIYGERESACYAYYEKAPFFDRWMEGQSGMLRQDGSSVMIQTDGFYHSNRIYVSLNLENVSKVVVTVNGKETVLNTEPEKSFVVITDDEIDDITFFTEDGGEISEKKFLQAP